MKPGLLEEIRILENRLLEIETIINSGPIPQYMANSSIIDKLQWLTGQCNASAGTDTTREDVGGTSVSPEAK